MLKSLNSNDLIYTYKDFCSLHFRESPHSSRQPLSAFNYNPPFLPSSSDWVSFARVNVSFDTLVISGNLGSRHLSIWRGGVGQPREGTSHSHIILTLSPWQMILTSSHRRTILTLSPCHIILTLSSCKIILTSSHHWIILTLSWLYHPTKLFWHYHPSKLSWHYHPDVFKNLNCCEFHTLRPCSAFPLLLLLLTSEWFAPIHWKPLNAALTWKAIHTTIFIVRNVRSSTVLCGFSLTKMNL